RSFPLSRVYRYARFRAPSPDPSSKCRHGREPMRRPPACGSGRAGRAILDAAATGSTGGEANRPGARTMPQEPLDGRTPRAAAGCAAESSTQRASERRGDGTAPRGKLVLIDAYSLIHRAYYALPSLTTSTGEPSNAVYGFAMMLLALLDEEQPDYVAAAFDRAGPTFRDELFAEYKANRAAMPDDLRPQIARVEQLLDAMNLAVYGVEGYEADDIIGTLARQASQRGLEVLIVTGDRDLLQLVDDRVTVLLTRRGIRDMERLDPRGVEEKLGVAPSRVPDLKGLMGDTSDN